MTCRRRSDTISSFSRPSPLLFLFSAVLLSVSFQFCVRAAGATHHVGNVPRPTRVSMKIVRTKAQPSTGSSSTPTYSYSPPEPVAEREPAPISGPVAYRSLDGSCYSHTHLSYEYRLCPFRNVTQKEVSGGYWNSFYGILGIWGYWDIQDGMYHSQHYTDGTECSPGTRRRIEVEFKCGGEYAISAVEEPTVCEYLLSLSCPEACGGPYAVTDDDLIPADSQPELWDGANAGGDMAGSDLEHEPEGQQVEAGHGSAVNSNSEEVVLELERKLPDSCKVVCRDSSEPEETSFGREGCAVESCSTCEDGQSGSSPTDENEGSHVDVAHLSDTIERLQDELRAALDTLAGLKDALPELRGT